MKNLLLTSIFTISTITASNAAITLVNGDFNHATDLFGWTGSGSAAEYHDGTQWTPQSTDTFRSSSTAAAAYQDLGHTWQATDVYQINFLAYDAGWRIGNNTDAAQVRLLQTDGTELWTSGTISLTGTVSGTENNLVFTGTSHIHAYTVDASSFITGAAGEELRLEISRAGGVVIIDDVSITVVPEPSSAALLGLGGLALMLRRRK